MSGNTGFDSEEMLQSMLSSLAKSRMENSGWRDAEEESSGTQVFKIGEALRPFYLVANREGESSALPLNENVLLTDTRSFFAAISRSGFFPSPYSPVESSDQYTDLAAFCVEFGNLVLRYCKRNSVRDRSLQKAAEATIDRAIDFLIDPSNHLDDREGVRWAGTSTHTQTVKGKIKRYYTNTYFTAVVCLALKIALEFPDERLGGARRDRVQDLIRRSGLWMARRNKRGLLSGDEEGDNQSLVYTTWGLRALAETYHIQSEDVRDDIKRLTASYLEHLDRQIREKGVAITQDYLPAFSTEFSTQLPYDERSSWAGALLALLSLSRVAELEDTLEQLEFPRVLDSVINGIMSLRDLSTDLWYKEFFIISFHSYMAEALIQIGGGVKGLGYAFEVTSGLVSRAVKEALEDARVVKLFQQVAYEKLQRLAIGRRQDGVIRKHLGDA